jgi:hypothetical protein
MRDWAQFGHSDPTPAFLAEAVARLDAAFGLNGPQSAFVRHLPAPEQQSASAAD